MAKIDWFPVGHQEGGFSWLGILADVRVSPIYWRTFTDPRYKRVVFSINSTNHDLIPEDNAALFREMRDALPPDAEGIEEHATI